MNKDSNHAPQEPTQPSLSREDIETLLPPRRLAKRWNNNRPGIRYFFLRPPWITTSEYSTGWFCPKTGKNGAGSITLVAHVLDISLDEAHRRLSLHLVTATAHDWPVSTNSRKAA